MDDPSRNFKRATSVNERVDAPPLSAPVMVMGDPYWRRRYAEALEKADQAPDPRLRALYLKLAEYYRSMLDSAGETRRSDDKN